MYGFVKRAVLKWVKVGVERVEQWENHLPQQQKRDVLWNDCTAVIVLPAKCSTSPRMPLYQHVRG